jgi:hypothetical protein
LTREQVEKEFILQEIERLKREDDPAALRAKVEALQNVAMRYKTMSTVEIMGENLNVDAHVREWESRCLKAESQLAAMTQERDELRELITQETQAHNKFTKWADGLKQQLAAMTQERDDAVDKREGAYMRLDGMTQERDRLKEALELCDPTGERLIIMANEDGEVRELCERVGYGAVMDSAARQWRKKDPIGACTVGPCVVTVQAALRGETGGG